MNIGFRHFTGLQWTGVLFIVSLPFILLTVFLGVAPSWWPVSLIADLIGVVFSLAFIEWPDADGFKSERQ